MSVSIRNLRQVAQLAVLMCVAVGCSTAEAPKDRVAAASSKLISDGAHNGVDHFFFLPPVVAAPTTTGTFDASLAPTLEICEWSGVDCVFPLTAEFSLSGGADGETITVHNDHYKALWHSGDYNLDPDTTYRIRVLLGVDELGFADVDVVSSGNQLKSVDTDEYIALLDGRTLPIKFRIESELDLCPSDPNKTLPGVCGCGTADDDVDSDGIAGCNDNCPDVSNASQADHDGDGAGELCDVCPADPADLCCDGSPGDPAETCNDSGSAAAEISASAGGVVATSGGELSLAVGASALSADTTISATHPTISDPEVAVELAGGPADGVVIANYAFEPSGLVFNNPATLTLVADVAGLNAVQRADLGIFLHTGAAFEPVVGSACTFNADTATCTAPIAHFSHYGLVASSDSDGDGIPDAWEGVIDNCRYVANHDQLNFDGDLEGDACDADDDNDGVLDGDDSDALNANVCRDVDGDTCDDCTSGTDDVQNDGADGDSDGICDASDNCAATPNADQANGDGDAYGDVCDSCPTDPNTCGANSTCEPAGCTCIAGYGGDPIAGCTDQNECAGEGTGNDCDANATCTNAPGSFSCACNSGFTGDGVTCTDVDECAAGTDNCSADASCANTSGSFTCSCNSGFTGDGVTCTDVDECAAGTDNCSGDASCANTSGSFTCSCNSGFTGDGVTCTDVDECAAGTDNCSADASCANTSGSFTCSCNSGFTGDGVTCTDVDECAAGTDNCSGDASCANTSGSFTCSCNSGFTGDGVTCTDVDECAAGTDNCSADASCANTSGSFTCSCNSGFTGDGVTCTDVDECAAGTDNCDANATCTNTAGSFSCACNPGFSGDGTSCSAALSSYRLDPSSPETSANLGQDVAIAGNLAIIGGICKDLPGDGSCTGSAYIFRYDPVTDSWTEEAALSASDKADNDRFGSGVAISGNWAVVGAKWQDEAGINATCGTNANCNNGAAYFYHFNGTSWVEAQKVIHPDTAQADQFGFAVAMQGGVAVIGAPDHDATQSGGGAAYVYVFDGVDWVFEEKLTTVDGKAFGYSISLDGDAALIGARNTPHPTTLPFNHNLYQYGAAYVFRFDGTMWNEEAMLQDADTCDPAVPPCDTVVDDFNMRWFGESVSLSGDVAVVGKPLDNESAARTGSAYIYRKVAGVWGLELKLLAPGAVSSDDAFGQSVAVSANELLIGKPQVSGNGAVHHFMHDGAAWIDKGPITASDGVSGDRFGQSIDLADGATIVSATSSDVAATNGGAAYVFAPIGDFGPCDVDPAAMGVPIAVGNGNQWGQIDFDRSCDLMVTSNGTPNRRLFRVDGGDGGVSDAATWPTGTFVIAAAADRGLGGATYVETELSGVATLWRIDASGAQTAVGTLFDRMTAIAVAPLSFGTNGGKIYGVGGTSGGNRGVYLIDPASGAATLVSPVLSEFGADLAFSADGSLLYVAVGTDIKSLDASGTFAQVLDIDNGTDGDIDGLAVHPDGSSLFVVRSAGSNCTGTDCVGRIDKILLSDTSVIEGPTVDFDGGSYPTGLVVDASGDVFIKTETGPQAGASPVIDAFDANADFLDCSVITFADPNLEAVVRAAIGVPTAPITDADVATLTTLGTAAVSQGITDISGIECLTALTNLQLGHNDIADIGPVANLTNLTLLWVQQQESPPTNDSPLTDISAVAGLVNLQSLGLRNNNIIDISAVAGLTSLTELWISQNPNLSDVTPLSGLTQLRSLYANDASIVNIGALSGLNLLEEVWLYTNSIVDISSLSGKSALHTARLQFNDINDVTPLSGLGSLTLLELQNNAIADPAPLASLTGAANVYLHNNVYPCPDTSIDGLSDAGVNVTTDCCGDTATTAGTSCRTVLDQCGGTDGTYSIAPGGAAFTAYCDMTDHGGGWILVGAVGEGANPTSAFNSDLNTGSLLGSVPAAGVYAHYALNTFDDFGTSWTLRTATDANNDQAHFQFAFYRPAPGSTLLPSGVGQNWNGTGIHLELLHLTMTSATGLSNITWLGVPGCSGGHCGNPLNMFTYRDGSIGGDCLAGGQTAICHAIQGGLSQNNVGTMTAAFGNEDGVSHAWGRKGTYWLKDVNVGGTP